jgi:glutathione peroxidase
VLIVNTASECGLTGQYKKLQELYSEYKNKGLVVLGVPCNDFGGQEPGSEEDIKAFTSDNYGIEFPMTSKYSVKGSEAHPFFVWASEQQKGGFLFSKPRWNFHKYLIDKNGDLYKSYSSKTSPESKELINDIEALLGQ